MSSLIEQRAAAPLLVLNQPNRGLRQRDERRIGAMLPESRAAAAGLRNIKASNGKRSNNHLLQRSERTMVYHSILVLLDRGPQCAARSQAAMRLANALDCHLQGVAQAGLVDLPVKAPATGIRSDVAARRADTSCNDVQRTVERFRQECSAAGVKSFDAVIDASDEASSFVHHAHCNDLTILTKADPADPDHRPTQDFVEYVVLHSARPTLILPYAGRFDTIGSIGTNVLVAWNDSREAARALSDALPFLRSARQVHVVIWNEGGRDDDKAEHLRFASLHQWLTRQGVSANVDVQATEIGIVGSMLACAADLKADLIVMGAYGHRTSTSHLLGGTTRGLLAEITVPVLMSH